MGSSIRILQFGDFDFRVPGSLSYLSFSFHHTPSVYCDLILDVFVWNVIRDLDLGKILMETGLLCPFECGVSLRRKFVDLHWKVSICNDFAKIPHLSVLV